MEEHITFIYEGKEYFGNLLRGEDLSPSFYWILFKDEMIKRLLGDELPFVIKGGELKLAISSVIHEYPDLLKSILSALKKYLGESTGA